MFILCYNNNDEEIIISRKKKINKFSQLWCSNVSIEILNGFKSFRFEWKPTKQTGRLTFAQCSTAITIRCLPEALHLLQEETPVEKLLNAKLDGVRQCWRVGIWLNCLLVGSTLGFRSTFVQFQLLYPSLCRYFHGWCETPGGLGRIPLMMRLKSMTDGCVCVWAQMTCKYYQLEHKAPHCCVLSWPLF